MLCVNELTIPLYCSLSAGPQASSFHVGPASLIGNRLANHANPHSPLPSLLSFYKNNTTCIICLALIEILMPNDGHPFSQATNRKVCRYLCSLFLRENTPFSHIYGKIWWIYRKQITFKSSYNCSWNI